MKIKAIFFFFACMLNLLQHAPSSLASPIIGGSSDESNVFKYQVSMLRMNPKTDEYFLFCSGGIVSERFVLSVANCYLEFHGDKKIPSVNLNEIKVLGGTNYFERNGIEKTVRNIFIPNSFDIGVNDIAVLEVNSNWGLTENKNIIEKLEPDYESPSWAFDGKRAIFSGFGPHIFGQTVYRRVSNYLTVRKFLLVRILPEHQCPDYEKEICAKADQDNDIHTACEDDRGSPLEYERKIIGVLHHSPLCNNHLESIKFTRVNAFSKFIRSAMSEHGAYSNMIILGEAQHRSTLHSSSSSRSHQSKHSLGNFVQRFAH